MRPPSECSDLLAAAALQLPAHLKTTNAAGHAPSRRRVGTLWAGAIGISILDRIVNRSFPSEPLRSFFLLRCRNRNILGFSQVYVRQMLLIRQFTGDAMPSLRVFDSLPIRLAEKYIAIA